MPQTDADRIDGPAPAASSGLPPGSTSAAPGRAPVQVIAEIGCNHRGELETAKELIRVAAHVCKADIAKFQKRHNRELLPPEQYDAPHPVPGNSYGDTYGAHREFLELDAEQHRELIACCRENGILYSTSVWDLTSAREMAALGPPLLKIPSATNQHWALQGWLCENYAGEIHVSTGMSTGREIAALVDFYEERGRAGDLVVYACTSGYPVAFEDVCLFEIRELMERYGARVRGVGFSGHHLGIAADVAALAVGRMMEDAGHGCFTHVERHFTLDRTWKGTDHAASLEPDGLRRLCRDIRNVDRALASKREEILPVEEVQRRKLKWRGPGEGSDDVGSAGGSTGGGAEAAE
jgi:N-acetylneuraminate synthase